MAYVLEFRDEHELDDVMEKMHKAKKAVCEAMEAMEQADGGNTMSERSMYRNGMSYRRGGGRYREAYRDGNDMEGRGEGRYSY